MRSRRHNSLNTFQDHELLKYVIVTATFVMHLFYLLVIRRILKKYMFHISPPFIIFLKNTSTAKQRIKTSTKTKKGSSVSLSDDQCYCST